MLRFGAVLSTLLLQASQPVALGLATGAAVFIAQAPVRAQTAEEVGRIAKAITVRIEGATQGSGVLVKREGNTYTVLTAWHVISSNNAGEEVDLIFQDGRSVQLRVEDFNQIALTDLGIIKFKSKVNFTVGEIGSSERLQINDPLILTGQPLGQDNVVSSIGKVIARADVGIENGYQMLYDNRTQPGMSGGPILNLSGRIVGIHGRGELDQRNSRQERVLKTGVNQGMPISLYNQYLKEGRVSFKSSSPATYDDYLAMARNVQGESGKEQTVLRLTSQALKIRETCPPHFMRGVTFSALEDHLQAINAYSECLGLEPNANTYVNRGREYASLGNFVMAIKDYDLALERNPRNELAWRSRYFANISLNRYEDAISDISFLVMNPDGVDDLIDYKYFLARAHYLAKDYEKAESVLDNLANNFSFASNLHDLHGLKGRIYADTGRHDLAVDEFVAAISGHPNAWNYYNYGNSLSALGFSSEAISAWSTSLSRADDVELKAFALNNRANEFFKSRRFKLALADFDESIKLNPNYVKALMTRGYIYLELGDAQRALSDFSQVISLNPEYSAAYYFRGSVKSKSGDLTGSLADLNKAIAFEPQNASAYYLRARIKRRLNDMYGECSDYKQLALLGIQKTAQWLQSDSGAWCRNMR